MLGARQRLITKCARSGRVTRAYLLCMTHGTERCRGKQRNLCAAPASTRGTHRFFCSATSAQFVRYLRVRSKPVRGLAPNLRRSIGETAAISVRSCQGYACLRSAMLATVAIPARIRRLVPSRVRRGRRYRPRRPVSMPLRASGRPPPLPRAARGRGSPR